MKKKQKKLAKQAASSSPVLPGGGGGSGDANADGSGSGSGSRPGDKTPKDRYEFSDFDLPDKSYGIGGGIDGTCDACE